MVCWRDPNNRKEQGITLPTESEAITLKRLLDANNQSFEIAQHAMVANQTKAPTVASPDGGGEGLGAGLSPRQNQGERTGPGWRVSQGLATFPTYRPFS